jgi:NAD(P)-dependent dehydrogenase (short-subunit alcohol dehydrogenase family)
MVDRPAGVGLERPGGVRVALVTGAATGIGRATAALLSSHGFHTFGTSRTPGQTSDPAVEMLPLEVGDQSLVRDCVGTVIDRTGRLDVLVNNVGGGIAGSVEETSLAEAQAVFEVNLWGAVRMTQAVLPTMRAQGGGRIIVMSFAADLVGLPFRGAYCASKFALESLFEALRFELVPTGIRVSIVKPGAVATPAADRVPRAATTLPAYRDARERATRMFDGAMRNGMPPERVARTVLRAATARRPRARYVVGPAGRSLYALQRIAPRPAVAAAVVHLLDRDK